MKHRSLASLLGAVLAFSSMHPVRAIDSKKLEVSVEATGTGETRERALIDACRLAVAKVHGTRVLGHMSNTDSSTFKLDAVGSDKGDKSSLRLEGGVYSTRDNTAISFDGYLLRFEIKKEEKQKSSRWMVQILATVLGSTPDRFEGKEAVTLPAVSRIAETLRGPGTPPEAVESIARALHRWAGETFSNHPNFVLLEREDESAIDSELQRAASESSAVKEKSKLKGQKVADIIVEIRAEPLVVEQQEVRFNAAPTLHKAQIKLRGSVRLLDTTTKGEICRSVFAVESAKPATAPDSAKAALSKALAEVEESLKASLRPLRFDLFSKLGMANIVFGEGGLWVLGGSLDPDLLQPGDKVSLWKGEGSAMSKVAESVLASSGGRLVFEDSSVKFEKGEAFTVRISQTAAPASPAPSQNKSSPPQKSLKDRLNFD